MKNDYRHLLLFVVVYVLITGNAPLTIRAGSATVADSFNTATFHRDNDKTQEHVWLNAIAGKATLSNIRRLGEYTAGLEAKGKGNIVNNYAFVVNTALGNQGFDIFDITDASDITYITSFRPDVSPALLNPTALDVKAVDTHNYIIIFCTDHLGIYRVAFTDYPSPQITEAGYFSEEDEAHGVKIHGTTAIISHYNLGIDTFDITSEESFEQGPLDSCDPDTNPDFLCWGADTQIQGMNAYAYVVQNEVESYFSSPGPYLHIVNITSPTNIFLAASLDLQESAFDVACDGNYSYIANGIKGLRIVDVSSPNNPSTAYLVDTPDCAFGVAFRHFVVGGVNHTYIYVADNRNGILIFDFNLDNPSTPTLAGGFDSSERALNCKTYYDGEHNVLCVAYEKRGLITLNVDLSFTTYREYNFESVQINYASTQGTNITAVKLTTYQNIPNGAITYQVTNKGGESFYWQNITPGNWLYFTGEYQGDDLRWRAKIQTYSSTTAPSIDLVQLEYTW